MYKRQLLDVLPGLVRDFVRERLHVVGTCPRAVSYTHLDQFTKRIEDLSDTQTVDRHFTNVTAVVIQ